MWESGWELHVSAKVVMCIPYGSFAEVQFSHLCLEPSFAMSSWVYVLNVFNILLRCHDLLLLILLATLGMFLQKHVGHLQYNES